MSASTVTSRPFSHPPSPNLSTLSSAVPHAPGACVFCAPGACVFGGGPGGIDKTRVRGGGEEEGNAEKVEEQEERHQVGQVWQSSADHPVSKISVPLS
jgi:hypothetical protein